MFCKKLLHCNRGRSEEQNILRFVGNRKSLFSNRCIRKENENPIFWLQKEQILDPLWKSGQSAKIMHDNCISGITLRKFW